jgi:hypothetical protein
MPTPATIPTSSQRSYDPSIEHEIPYPSLPTQTAHNLKKRSLEFVELQNGNRRLMANETTAYSEVVTFVSQDEIEVPS